MKAQGKQTIIWLGALAAGAGIGLLGIDGIDSVMSFIATVYTRLFQLLAVPTIALAVTVTLASMGGEKSSGVIFRHALSYTLLTTLVASLVGLGLYLLISPSDLPAGLASGEGSEEVSKLQGGGSYLDYFTGVIPNNIVRPFLEGNVLSILLLSFAIGLALSHLPQSDRKTTVMNFLLGLQDILFMLIRWLIWSLPLGIMAFSAQLVSQVSAGMALASLGQYTAVILLGNFLQIFLILPLFLLSRGINPVRAFGRMSPALLTAFFTKSSAATLPLTMETAEKRMGVSPKVSRFVLPICTTINMNGCAAFILVTSLFVMQNSGMPLSAGTMLLWVLLSVVAAIGNAGVPMGCFFLTVSLMTGIGANVGIMGVLLPIYTIIDMVETAENVWSDSSVAIMTDHDLREKADQ